LEEIYQCIMFSLI